MAVALHRRYGGQIVGIFDEVWDTVPRHVGVYLPSGKFADARGLSLTQDQFLHGFHAVHGGFENTKIEKMTEERVKHIWRNRQTNWDVADDELQALGLITDDK